MKPEDQRIAIAEACGWTGIHMVPFTDKLQLHWRQPFGTSPDGEQDKPIPDYLSSLDAMHEAEKVIRKMPTKWHTYRKRLNWRPDYGVCATADQRAEDFLKTLDLWTDEP